MPHDRKNDERKQKMRTIINIIVSITMFPVFVTIFAFLAVAAVISLTISSLIEKITGRKIG